MERINALVMLNYPWQGQKSRKLIKNMIQTTIIDCHCAEDCDCHCHDVATLSSSNSLDVSCSEF